MDSDDMLVMYPESESDSDVNEIKSHEPVRPSHGPAKRKCPPRDQPFMDSWLTIPEFNGWLMKKLHCKKMKSYCKLCEKVLTCSKTGIKRHEVSKKHQEKLETTTIDDNPTPPNDQSSHNC